MFCVFCGSQMPDDMFFCPNCGKKAERPPVPVTADVHPAAGKERQNVPAAEPVSVPAVSDDGGGTKDRPSGHVTTLKGLRCPDCGSELLQILGKKGALGKSAATVLAFGAIGQVVAGKVAASDQTTYPLQYRCQNCRNKFESLPLSAPPEDILKASCPIAFSRVRRAVGSIVPMIVYLNGVNMGPVNNGATIFFTTENRYNTIFVTDQHGVSFEYLCRFEARAGESVSISFDRSTGFSLAGGGAAQAANMPQATIPAQIPKENGRPAAGQPMYGQGQAAQISYGQQSGTLPANRQPIPRVGGFHKFTSILNVVVSGLLLILAIAALTGGAYVPMLVLFLLSLSILALGIFSIIAWKSHKKPYPQWMKILNLILFILEAQALLALLIIIAIEMG